MRRSSCGSGPEVRDDDSTGSFHFRTTAPRPRVAATAGAKQRCTAGGEASGPPSRLSKWCWRRLPSFRTSGFRLQSFSAWPRSHSPLGGKDFGRWNPSASFAAPLITVVLALTIRWTLLQIGLTMPILHRPSEPCQK